MSHTDMKSLSRSLARPLALVVPVLFVIGDRERLPVFSPHLPLRFSLSLPSGQTLFSLSLFLLFFCFEFLFLLPFNISSFLSFLFLRHMTARRCRSRLLPLDDFLMNVNR